MAFLSAGSVLWLLAFWGFALNYTVRVNLNIAIVAMVRQRAPAAAPATAGYYGARDNTSQQVAAASQGSANLSDPQRLSLASTVHTVTSTEAALANAAASDKDGRYDWDEHQQGLVLGAYFWLHWLTQIPGGVLARRVGPKLVFGLSNMSGCLLAALSALAADADYRALVALRALQGLLTGMAWPSMHCMTANWVPPNDRSKFVSAYLGSSVGAALTFPVSGVLIGWLGWPAIFYATTLLGITWFLAWWLLVFDHPHEHPRISRTELHHLQLGLVGDPACYKPATPWRSIVTSRQVWLLVLVKWGCFWVLNMLMTQAPTYLRNIHGWSFAMVGLLSGIPHVGRTVFALLISRFGDFLLKKEVISRPRLRKVAISSYMLVAAALLAGLSCSGHSPSAAAVLMVAAVSTNGAIAVGPLAAQVDISPSFCSILMGLANTVCTLPGFISPAVVGMLTYQNQTPERWRAVFLISAAMAGIPGAVYALFGNPVRQPWDQPSKQLEDIANREDARPLKAGDCIVDRGAP